MCGYVGGRVVARVMETMATARAEEKKTNPTRPTEAYFVRAGRRVEPPGPRVNPSGGAI
jgi:hypothetical protein